MDELIKLKSRYAAETGNIMARADDLVHLYLKRVKEKEKWLSPFRAKTHCRLSW